MLNLDFPRRYLNSIGFYKIDKRFEKEIFSSNKVHYHVNDPTHRFAPMYTHVVSKTLEHLGINLEEWSNKNILDICSGNGYLSYHLLKLNPLLKITLLDINQAELENAKKNLSEIETVNPPTFVSANFSETKIEDEYDIVVGSSFLHHFPDVGYTIKQIHDMLKPGGIFVSFYEPTLAANGWEKYDTNLALNAAFWGEEYLEKFRTLSNAPLQTTDVWDFKIDDLRKLFIKAGFNKVHTLPMSIAYCLQHWKKVFDKGSSEQRLQITKDSLETDWRLIEYVPEELFGACAMSGIRELTKSDENKTIDIKGVSRLVHSSNKREEKKNYYEYKKRVLHANKHVKFYDHQELLTAFTKSSVKGKNVKRLATLILPYNTNRRRVVSTAYGRVKTMTAKRINVKRILSDSHNTRKIGKKAPLLPDIYPSTIPNKDIDAVCNKYRTKGYNVASYHLISINRYSRKVNFKGKCVLEIGGSNLPSDLVLGTIGAKKWVCIDTDFRSSAKEIKHYDKNSVTLTDALKSDDYICFNMFGEDISEDFYGHFDICISNACFEHVRKMEDVLKKISLSLKPGGVFLTEFGPIWSSAYGSHFRYKLDVCDFNNPGLIPPFAHLLLSIEEIYQLLKKQFPSDTDNELLQGAYDIKYGNGYFSDVNQLFFEDYETFFNHSDFSRYEISIPWEYNVGCEHFKELQQKYRPYKRFNVFNVFITGVKE